jgi:hypothetical protein
MHTYQVSASREIAAPAGRVWGILADYQKGHPKILPSKYFQDVVVVDGGVGAGTVVAFRMRLLGQTQVYRMAVTEPEPGRVLRETDTSSGVATSFVVDPLEPGRRVRVTIVTELRSRGGPLGALERFLARAALRRVYIEELALLAALVESSASTASTAAEAARLSPLAD